MIDQVLENEGLVYSIINKCHGYYDKDDLYQVGIIGLIDASKKFDSSMGVKFSTYAYKYILGEVTKYMRENVGLRVSREVLKLKQSINHTRDILRQRLSREPTTEELSVFLEIDEKKIQEVDSITQDVQSLDFCYQEENDNLYNSVRVEEQEFNPNVLDLKSEIEKLEPLEKKIIYSRYYNDLTQSETSKELGISQVQVSRKEAKILEKLKTRL